MKKVPKYYPTPEETAECMRCGHRANVCEFWPDGKEDNGSECPKCGCVDDTPPRLDEEDIARDTAVCAEAIVLTERERDSLIRPYSKASALVLATVVRGLAAEVERLREELRIARGDFTPAERDQQDFLSGTFEDRQDNA